MKTAASGTEQIHAEHRKRMMESYLTAGFDSFSDVEALEFLLSFSIPRRDVNPLAHALLREFGALHRVFEAPIPRLTRVPGVGPRTAALIHLTAELWGRCEQDRLSSRLSLRNMGEIGRFLSAKAEGLREEHAWLLCLDARCRMIECRELCSGSVNAVNLPFRRVVETALLANATSVILAHNHTSGTLLPSVEDIEYTRDLSRALSIVDVILFDHVILGDHNWLSLKNSNMMP